MCWIALRLNEHLSTYILASIYPRSSCIALDTYCFCVITLEIFDTGENVFWPYVSTATTNTTTTEFNGIPVFFFCFVWVPDELLYDDHARRTHYYNKRRGLKVSDVRYEILYRHLKSLKYYYAFRKLYGREDGTNATKTTTTTTTLPARDVRQSAWPVCNGGVLESLESEIQ